MAFAQLSALVEAAARRENGGEEEKEEEEEEVYVLLDFSSAELPPGVELRGDLAIDVRRTTSRCPARAPPRARPTRGLVFFLVRRRSTRRRPPSSWASTCFAAPMRKTLAAR